MAEYTPKDILQFVDSYVSVALTEGTVKCGGGVRDSPAIYLLDNDPPEGEGFSLVRANDADLEGTLKDHNLFRGGNLFMLLNENGNKYIVSSNAVEEIESEEVIPHNAT